MDGNSLIYKLEYSEQICYSFKNWLPCCFRDCRLLVEVSLIQLDKKLSCYCDSRSYCLRRTA